MGHDAHFLSRLDRVSTHHVDLALCLYRDAGLVRFVLDATRIAERAPRVALSLDHDTEGPFVVVARDGGFVTCLGAGMSTGDLPVITRSRLEALVHRARDHAERTRIAAEMKEEDLFGRLHTAGRTLSREEVVALTSFHPLLSLTWARVAVNAYQKIESSIPALRANATSERSAAVEMRALLWQRAWSIGHASALIAHDARAFVDAVEQLAPGQATLLLTALVGMCSGIGLTSVAARGFYLAGKAGRAYLTHARKSFQAAIRPVEVLSAVGSLTAIGVRHEVCRAEARKALTHHPLDDLARSDVLSEEDREHVLTTFTAGPKLWRELALELLEDATRHREVIRMLGARLLEEGEERRRRSARGNPAPVSEADALAAFHATNAPSLDVNGAPLTALAAAASSYRSAVEDLYLPAQAVVGCGLTPFVRDATALLQGFDARHGRAHTVRAAPVPGRNDPCSCGSGKKYKKCCA